MTESQIGTLVVTLLAIVLGSLFNNARISDLNARINDVNRHIDDKFSLLSLQMKNMEENILKLIGDHEIRIQKLEKPK